MNLTVLMQLPFTQHLYDVNCLTLYIFSFSTGKVQLVLEKYQSSWEEIATVDG